MKRAILILFALCAALPTFGQDASTAWRDIMKKCAKIDLIGKESLLFGVIETVEGAKRAHFAPFLCPFFCTATWQRSLSAPFSNRVHAI